MAYGKIKADTLVYDNSGSDVEVTLSSLGNKANLASPTFTGTVTIPTPAANDNTTKAASTAYVQTELGDYALKASPTFTGTINGAALTLSGNLTVQGTTTTISSTTIDVADKNIELGKVSTPTDTTADGGGITLKGASDKTFNWVDATDAWTSSEHIHLGDDKKLLVGTGSDLEIYHNGLNSIIKNSNGWLVLGDGGSGTVIKGATNANALSCTSNGAVEVYHASSKKLETTAAGVTVTGTVTDSKGDVRSIPKLDKTSAYTLIASDAGKAILITTGGITIPNSVFSAGDAVTIINRSGSDQTITQGSGLTLYNAADGSTGNRTLGARGIATGWFSAAGGCYISGAGLS